MSSTTEAKAGAFVGRVAGGSGEDANQRFLGVLRLEGNGGHILGTAVLVKPSWALAVAHCVAAFPSQLFVHHLPQQWRAKVVHVSWLGSPAMRHPFPFDPDLEGAVRDMAGEHDCLVLLRLEAGANSAPAPAITRAGDNVMSDDLLAICGYGKDGEGNYPSVYPNFGYLSFKQHEAGRGEFTENASHALGGYPMGDDSGAPIYAHVDSREPEVVGLHAARVSTDKVGRSDGSMTGVVFQFLPLTEETLKEIEEIVATPLPEAGAASPCAEQTDASTEINTSGPQVPPIPWSDRFTFRRTDCCTRMQDVKSLVGKFFLYHAKGGAGFRQCDVVEITRLSQYVARVRYEGVLIGTQTFEATLYRATGQPTDRCWLEGIGKDGACFFFLLMRGVAGRNKRRLLVEYFKKNSLHSKPHAGVIQDGWIECSERPYYPCPKKGNDPAKAAGWASGKSVVQNQDDDGRGDE